MKLETILNNLEAIKTISKREMPIRASYAIAKNIGKIESELKIYNAEREKLIKKYSETDENGCTVISDRALFEKELGELMQVDCDINFHKFSIDALGNCNFTPVEIMALDEMLEDIE